MIYWLCLQSSPCRSILVLAQSVTSCVKLVCEWLSFIEPPEVTEAVYEFKRACKTATQPEVETSSFFPTEVSTLLILHGWIINVSLIL